MIYVVWNMFIIAYVMFLLVINDDNKMADSELIQTFLYLVLASIPVQMVIYLIRLYVGVLQ